MDKDFHISRVAIQDSEILGKIIRVHTCPYEDTPLGYCYIDNKPADFVYPYSDEVAGMIRELEEIGDIELDPSDFFYDKDFGFIHNVLLQSFRDNSKANLGRIMSEDTLCNEFDADELALVFLGFNRAMFTPPRKGEMHWKKHPYDNGCTLFFQKDYLNSLKEEYVIAKDSGKFAMSNANNKWLRVLHLLSNPNPAYADDLSSAYDYSGILSH